MRNKSAEHFKKTSRDVVKEARERLSSILTYRQRRRLREIEMWTLGMKAFLRDDIAERFELNQKQQDDIRMIFEETQASRNELSGSGRETGKAEDTRKQAIRIRIEEQRKVLAILTRRQRQTWEKSLGTKIDVRQLGRVTFRAPNLIGQEGWINSPPLSLEQLKGQVVALHFYAFTCVSCQRNYPWYKEWYESFKNQGLTVLGVHTPETSHEREFANFRRDAMKTGLEFPILVDSQNKNWNSWGNSMWPSVYLIDKQGHVRYCWHGKLNWQENHGGQIMRQRITELIKEDSTSDECAIVIRKKSNGSKDTMWTFPSFNVLSVLVAHR